jgi:Aldo/keto reductase family
MIRQDCRFHLRHAKVCVLIEQRGATLRYLPPHSHTAHGYGGGTGEQMLGDLGAAQRFTLATRYDPQGANHAQERDKLKAAFRVSLTRLKTDRVKILYLTTRDHTVPLERPRELERVAVWMAQQPNRVIAGHRSSRI